MGEFIDSLVGLVIIAVMFIAAVAYIFHNTNVQLKQKDDFLSFLIDYDCNKNDKDYLISLLERVKEYCNLNEDYYFYTYAKITEKIIEDRLNELSWE